jgi:hypothetical protein
MSVIRTVKTPTTSALISLDEIGSKSYRFWAMTPPWFETADSFNNVPVIIEKEDTLIGHPFLRPFDRYIYEGIPDIGKIFYILLRPSIYVFPKVICSITLSKNKKQIYIYPAWGCNELTLQRGETLYPGKSPIHHITLRKDNCQIHMSPSREIGGEKQKTFPAATLKLRNNYGIHIGTFVINDGDSLDSGGIVSRNLSKIPHSINKMNKIIEDSINAWHPIIELAPELKWVKGNRLEISFVITDDSLNDVNYPTGRITQPPKEFFERMVKIPLDKGINILIKISSFAGKMNQSFKWLTVRQR